MIEMKDFNTPPPIVSIILPVYNAGKYLKECVISILEQTFDSYEFLILDDGSTDGCTDFSLCGDKRTKKC